MKIPNRCPWEKIPLFLQPRVFPFLVVILSVCQMWKFPIVVREKKFPCFCSLGFFPICVFKFYRSVRCQNRTPAIRVGSANATTVPWRSAKDLFFNNFLTILSSGREGLHVSWADLEAAEPPGPEEPELAHPAMLCSVRWRVSRLLTFCGQCWDHGLEVYWTY